MAVIYKYPFFVSDRVAIEMPLGAKVLHIEPQDGTPMLWALVEPSAVMSRRVFRVVGTGHQFDPSKLEHVATFQQPPFVWHVFE